MLIERLSPDRLQLNPDNDRHGSLKDEATCIQWLLQNRDAHMRALAEDLATSKRLYEPPLVQAGDAKHTVFDGNRRICCVKLLIDPKLAPSAAWVDFFSELKSPEITAAFDWIECEVESDLAVIDEMLFRRHTGSQDGVGRSQWDPEGKSYFLQRTGKASSGLGEVIERALKAEQLISDSAELPWSMRVLLELAVRQYARDHGLVFAANDYFAKRVSSVADSMQNRDLIDQKARSIIRKFESDKPVVSAHSMHQYVHNPDFHPSRSDMKAIWNVIRAIVVNSVK